MYLRCDTFSSNLENLDLDSIAPKHLMSSSIIAVLDPDQVHCIRTHCCRLDYRFVSILGLAIMRHGCSLDCLIFPIVAKIPCLSKSVLLCSDLLWIGLVCAL